MSNNCAELALTADIVAGVCGGNVIEGTGADVYLIDIDARNEATSTLLNQDTISALTLKSGKEGFKFTSLPDSAYGESTVATGTYQNQFNHSIKLRAFVRGDAVKELVRLLNNTKVAVCIENKDAGTSDEVPFEWYGLESGMEQTEIISQTVLQDGNVVLELTLASGEKAKESTMPKSYLATDRETTRAALEALLTAAA